MDFGKRLKRQNQAQSWSPLFKPIILDQMSMIRKMNKIYKPDSCQFPLLVTQPLPALEM